LRFKKCAAPQQQQQRRWSVVLLPSDFFLLFAFSCSSIILQIPALLIGKKIMAVLWLPSKRSNSIL
jgi:hypothetical protein